MKVLFIMLISVCVLQSASGQLSGKLINSDRQPVSLANVLLMGTADTAVVKAALTNDSGYYEINPNRAGKYFLRFSSIGYETFDSPVFGFSDLQKPVDMGLLVMKAAAKSLEEVSIRSIKPLFSQQPSGTIINVENSILTKGSSILEVLERSPGVIIDHRNNDISLNGKGGVMVMLNGKLMRMSMPQVVTLLNSMSADDISTIELLTSPPASYDAEGSAGLINIVTKKIKKQGINGSLSLTAGYGWREKAGSSINVSRNTEKLSMYGSYTFSHNRSYNDLFIAGVSDQRMARGASVAYFWNTSKPVQDNHNATAGIDIRPDSTITIGAAISFNKSNNSSDAFNQARYFFPGDSVTEFKGNILGKNRWTDSGSSVYLEKTFSNQSKLSLGMDYSRFDNNNPSYIHSSFLDKHGNPAGDNDTIFAPYQQGFAHTLVKVSVGKLDYFTQWSKAVKFESGIKGTYTTVSSESGIESLVNNVWQSRDGTSGKSGMQESIAASYISVTASVNPSLSLVTGLRFEYVHTHIGNPATNITSVDRHKGMLFPGILLSQKLTERSGLDLSYTKRISRPSYNDLASYTSYADPTAVFTGNPFLKAAVTSNIKLGYHYSGYSVSLLFSRDENPIARYQLTEDPAGTLLYVSPQNLAWQNNMLIQANLPWRVNNWWSMSYSFTGGLRQFKLVHTLQPVVKKYVGYSFNASQLFTLPGQFSIELSGWYNSLGYNGSMEVGGFGAINGGIKKELKNNKGSFQFAVTDFLKIFRIRSSFGALTKEVFSIANQISYNTESRKFPIMRLTYTRSFGLASNNIQRKQNNAAEEERERVRRD